MIEYDLIEHPSGRLSALIAVDDVRPELLQGKGISDGLAKGQIETGHY